jgi:hypothetical protein
MPAENEWGPGKLTVSRNDCVAITIACPSEYDAMMVYDRALRNVSRGKIAFDLDTEMPKAVKCDQ